MVMMRMGELLLNYDPVVAVMHLMMHDHAPMAYHLSKVSSTPSSKYVGGYPCNAASLLRKSGGFGCFSPCSQRRIARYSRST